MKVIQRGYNLYYNKKTLKKIKKYEQKVADVFVVVSEIDKKGNVIKKYSAQYKKRKSKKGWSRMYHKDYAKTTTEIIKENPFAMILFNYFLENGYLKKDGTIKPFKQIELANQLNTTRQRISRALKTLTDYKMIEKYNNELFYNPFLICISGTTEEQISENQIKWEELFGHYTSSKDN